MIIKIMRGFEGGKGKIFHIFHIQNGLLLKINTVEPPQAISLNLIDILVNKVAGIAQSSHKDNEALIIEFPDAFFVHYPDKITMYAQSVEKEDQSEFWRCYNKYIFNNWPRRSL